MAVSGGFRPGEMTTILSRGEMTAGLAWGLPDNHPRGSIPHNI